jgi:hypothetical protein
MLFFLKNVFIYAQNVVFHFKMISFEDISFQIKIFNFLFQNRKLIVKMMALKTERLIVERMVY